ncbi:hypothetical protein N480_17615 [Pseudoalteromonas luteoviolacea S2607]|uniref:GNAT family N-acetyltransferase n=1 Tax=Pseudoalteromonas luteoviolacea TaxID=43657 RepID=UPI0007B05D2C|nr:GNAT family N-acetyltransferase [Pseudoalteromonas luteoviolacea]KZN36518.1 hypothetical protein N480_17615 [Pseudoalteromonas luteoviolacea S2607]
MTKHNKASSNTLDEVFNGVEYATLRAKPESTKITNEQRLDSPFEPALSAKVWPVTIQDLGYNQAWVELYVESILAWLHEANDSQIFELSKPVYLMQLGAANYRLGLALLHSLAQALAPQGLIKIKLCMIFTVDDEKMQTLLFNHPDFGYFYERQQAQIVNWEASSSNPIPTHALDGSALMVDANPVVLISHKVFSQLSQAIYHIHYNQIFRAELAPLSSSVSNAQHVQGEMPLLWEMQKQQALNRAEQHNSTLALRWLQTSIDEEVNDDNGVLGKWLKTALEHHTLAGMSRSIAIPYTAAKVIRAIELAFPKGGMQLICDEAQQSQGVAIPANIGNREITLPIDFSVLNQLLLNECNAQISTLPVSDEKVSISMNHRLSNTFDYTRHAFERICKSSSPETSAHITDGLSNIADVLNENQIQAHLVESGYDPKVLAIFLPRLLKKGVSVLSRLSWCEMLDTVWQNHVVDMEYETFAFELGLLAIDLSHWALAKSCMLMRMEISGPSTACLHNLALSAWATGELDIAEQSITLALDLNPEDAQVQGLQSDILAYRKRCTQLAWFDPSTKDEQIDEGELQLLPLGQHQLGEFFLQYSRSDIAQRLRGMQLNKFEDLESLWPVWAAEGDSCKKSHLAVVHNEHGLVGGIVFDFDIEEQGVVHLSFWIGSDYQGQGYGKEATAQAIKMITVLANELGISHITTSAWTHNSASRQILTFLGFEQLEKTKGEGIHQEVFYLLDLNNT